MPAADASEHGRDMAVADLERLAELAVAPGDARQAPLEGGDRKLRRRGVRPGKRGRDPPLPGRAASRRSPWRRSQEAKCRQSAA